MGCKSREVPCIAEQTGYEFVSVFHFSRLCSLLKLRLRSIAKGENNEVT